MILSKKSQIWKAAFVAIVLTTTVALPTFAIKPQPPLKLHLATTDLLNGQIELTLHATASMAVPSAEIFLHLPESLSLLDGMTKWAGPMDAGEEKKLILLLQAISTVPSAVLAEGTVALPHGGSFTQHATLPIHPTLPPLKSPPPIRRKQGRETILEFSAK